MASPLKVNCPQCGKEIVYSTDNVWRPFCSQRCKQIDLGAWANEEYRVPVVDDTDEASPDGNTALSG